jgi:hypothetical protein
LKISGQAPPVERQPVSFRLRAGLRDQAKEAALREGKSLSEMINDLLERGLDADRPLYDVFGSPAGFAVARALLAQAEAVAVKSGADQGLWLHDVEIFDRVAEAIGRTLETLRPVPEAQAAQAAMTEAQAALEHARTAARPKRKA